MTDLQSSMTFGDDYSSGLTEYNKDGLEIFVHNDGSVHADVTAISRMCEVSQGAIYRKVVTSTDSKTPFITHKRKTESGVRSIHLYPVSVVVACAKKYNPTLMDKFAEMGAMVYLYKLAGYTVNPVIQPADPIAPPSILAIAKQAQKLLNEQIEQLTYIEDKPGLTAIMATAHDKEAPTEGFMSFDEMCDYRGIPRFKITVKRILAKNLTATIGNLLQAEVKTKTVVHPRDGMCNSYYKVKAFPVDCLAAFDNVIAKYSK